MLDAFTPSTFSVGDRLTLRPAGGDDEHQLEVLEVLELTGDSTGRKPFSVLFLGPDEPILGQQTYQVAHPEVGPFDLFLVPLGPRKEGGARYEAIFA